MKNRAQILLYEILCLPFLIFYMVATTLENNDIYFIFLGYQTPSIIILIFLILELILFIITKFKKIVRLLVIIFTSLMILMVTISLISSPKYKTIDLKNYDHDLIVCSDDYFMSGWSVLYEKENTFIMRKFDLLAGDEAYKPLNDETTYQFVYYENGFMILYHDGNEDTYACYQYENNEISRCELEDLVK